MKKALLIICCFIAGLSSAQTDELPVATDVTVSISGLSENNTIAKSKLIKAKQLVLTGPSAAAYSIVSYVATYSGKDGLTEEEMEGADFSIDMANFFHIIEKNSRLSFKGVVLKSGSGKKLFKAAPLHVIVHAEE
ncbi:MAG: hypothetical protein ACXVPQ_00320 [Bacteroidia bacterium]